MEEIYYLKNGFPVLLEKVDTVKSVAVGIFVNTGSKHEKMEEAGISHFIEHMLFKGTKNRTAKEISEEIDFVGGHINAYTGKELTVYYCTLLDEQINVAIDVLYDMYTNSQFPEQEIEKEKKVIIEEINMYEDIPEEKIHDFNSECVLKGSGNANSILGSVETVNSFTKNKIIEFFKERYTTKNTIIAISGNFDKEKIISNLEENFGNIIDEFEMRDFNSNFVINSGENRIEKDTNQVHLCVNVPAISYLDDERYVITALSNILGGNMSSRLFQKVREEKGLAYSIYCYVSTYKEGGILTVYAGTTSDSYIEAVEIIKTEIELLKHEKVTERELDKVKNQLISDTTIGLESTKSRMNRLAYSYIRYGEIKNVDIIINNIKKITVDDVMNCAKRLFDEKMYSVTLLGNFKEK